MLLSINVWRNFESQVLLHSNLANAGYLGLTLNLAETAMANGRLLNYLPSLIAHTVGVHELKE
jgi:hypothetical protein